MRDRVSRAAIFRKIIGADTWKVAVALYAYLETANEPRIDLI